MECKKKEGVKMHLKNMKRWSAVALAGVMAVSLMGCGGNEKEQTSPEPAEATTEAAVEDTGDDSEDFVDTGVTLPSDFGDMIYPLTSLMVEASAKGLPYYSEDSTEDEADSFWFSMAVLASLMNDYVKDFTVDTDENYLYLEEDTVNMYASTLYDAYAQGNLEFPELAEDDTYAVYNEDDNTYGFLSGGIGTMKAYITDCEEDGSDYVLTAELRDTDSEDLYGRYQITITENSYDGEENAFAYSVSDFEEADEEENDVDFSEGATEENGDDADEDTSEEMTTEDADETDDTEEESEEESTDDADSSETTEEEISEDDALALAEEYYGDEAEYTFKDIVTIGDYEYYDFAVEGDSVSSTDVLVSVDGENVLGGVQNDDGSWSFDQ